MFIFKEEWENISEKKSTLGYSIPTQNISRLLKFGALNRKR